MEVTCQRSNSVCGLRYVGDDLTVPREMQIFGVGVRG